MAGDRQLIRTGDELGDTEVNHSCGLPSLLDGKQHVTGLDVAVNDPNPVSGGDRPGDAAEDVNGLTGSEPTLAERLLQVPSADELHHDVIQVQLRVRPVVEDLHDVGVVGTRAAAPASRRKRARSSSRPSGVPTFPITFTATSRPSRWSKPW